MTVFIALVEIRFEIPMARSLKDRRQGIEPFKAKVARIAHYAVAEEDDGEPLWNRAVVWAVLAQSAGLMQQRISKLQKIADSNPSAVTSGFSVYDQFDLKQ
jgi:uncharacterized protein YlxP (DUF503 family)